MKKRLRRERGATAVVMAVMLMGLGGLVALSINVGRIMVVRNQTQNAVDSAALAGANELNGTAAAFLSARLAAQDYGGEHFADRTLVQLDANLGNAASGDIVLGVWDAFAPDPASAFTAAAATTPPSETNAILVRTGRSQKRGNPLTVVLSPFLGQEEASVGAEAIAVAGGPCDACSVPLVFADCQIKNPDGSLNCQQVLRFADDTVDNVGFTNLEPGNNSVSTSKIIETLENGCKRVEGGDSVGVSNGNNLNKHVVDAFQRYMAERGNRVHAPIISPGSCPSPKFNQLQPIVGFATFTILDVQDHPREITVQLDCEEEMPEPTTTGCGDYGTTVLAPQLKK